jgi:hypothetical protein
VGKSGLSSDNESTPFIEVREASGWHVDPAPQPANSALNGVSCASAAACVAVGSRSGRMLAELWNGAGWAIHSPPDPAGSSASQLNGASCISPSACIAVGDVQELAGGDNDTLAETWNGSNWTEQRTPNASSTQSGVVNDQLSAVWCVSAAACTAVGTNSDHKLAEHWDGSNWTIQSMPDGAGAGTSVPRSVACASADSCEAVGFSQAQGNPDTARPLREGWSSGTWSLQSAPTGALGQLNGVSCARTCIAVGSAVTSQGFAEPLAEVFS